MNAAHPAPSTPKAVRSRMLTRVVAAVAGLSLWAQCAIGHAVELAWGTGAVLWRATALAAAFIALIVAVWRRAPAVVYGVFPISLLGPILLLGDGARASLLSPWRWGTFCAAFAVWIYADGLSGAILRPAASEPLARTEDDGRWFQTLRSIGGLALLVVPLVTLVGRTPEEWFADGSTPDVGFVHLLLVFLWIVAWYAYFVTPALNDAFDRSRFARRLGAPRGVRKMYLGIALAVALAVASAIGVWYMLGVATEVGA